RLESDCAGGRRHLRRDRPDQRCSPHRHRRRHRAHFAGGGEPGGVPGRSRHRPRRPPRRRAHGPLPAPGNPGRALISFSRQNCAPWRAILSRKRRLVASPSVGRMKVRLVAVVVGLLLMGCSPADAAPTTASPATTAATTTTTTTARVSTTGTPTTAVTTPPIETTTTTIGPAPVTGVEEYPIPGSRPHDVA